MATFTNTNKSSSATLTGNNKSSSATFTNVSRFTGEVWSSNNHTWAAETRTWADTVVSFTTVTKN